MRQVEKDIDLICDFMKWNNDSTMDELTWNQLMLVANELKNISKYKSVTFNETHLSFDYYILFENIVNYIKWLNKNTTYTESKNKPPFDWYKFLNKEKYTFDELYDKLNLSRNWVTCACGNQCSVIPRYENGCPIDGKLSALGIKFTRYIKLMCNNLDLDNKYSFLEFKNLALEILGQIEERSSEILKEMNL